MVSRSWFKVSSKNLVFFTDVGILTTCQSQLRNRSCDVDGRYLIRRSSMPSQAVSRSASDVLMIRVVSTLGTLPSAQPTLPTLSLHAERDRDRMYLTSHCVRRCAVGHLVGRRLGSGKDIFRYGVVHVRGL